MSSLAFVIVIVFRPSDRYVVIFHYDFNLHFPNISPTYFENHYQYNNGYNSWSMYNISGQ